MTDKPEISVLHVEDSPDDAELIAHELRKAYRIRHQVVATAHELLEALKEKWDIVLSDFSMPGFSGLEALEIIKKNTPDLPFVFVSGTIGEERAVTAIKSGATDFVIKDSLKRLIPVVDRVLKDAESGRRLRETEENLIKSRRMYELLAQNATDIISIFNSDLVVGYVSPAVIPICDLTPEQVIGTNGVSFIHPIDREAYANALGTALKTNNPFQISFRFDRADGKRLWLETVGKTIVNPATGSKDILTVTRDITERVNAEARVREQAALLDIARDAIIVRDLEHRIVYWNKGAQRIYGWKSEEVVGQPVDELIYEDYNEFEAAMITLLSTGEFNGELHQKSRSGEKLIVDSSLTLVRDERGVPKSVLCINSDITERKKFEEQFFRSQRMDSIGTLAGGIAHDLNNMLTPILLAIEILKLDNLNPEQQELISTIQFSAKRGAEMVKQVLTFARGAEGEYSPMRLNDLMADIGKLVRDTFPKNINLSLDIARDLWQIKGNATQLHQVLINLAVNARDAMAGGGTLIVSAQNQNLDAQYAKMSGEISPGNFVVIRVEDTGSGMPSATLDKIFEPFFTTKEQGKGTGLGLSTSMSIVKGHGGIIRAYSEPGRGTQFHVFLPAITHPAGPNLARAEEPLPHGHGELILIVDDEKMIREITRQTLESFGYRAKMAADGAEGLAAYVENKDDIRLIITDMMMPVLDGAGMIQAIRKLNPSLPIFATSGLGENGQNFQTTDGISLFLAKPYTSEVLLKSVHKVLQAG